MYPKISPSVITEYTNRESDIRWYFALVGDLAATEPFLHGWASQEILRELSAPEMELPPHAVVHFQTSLRKMFVRGVYFGKRHEMVNWMPELMETPLTDRSGDAPKPLVTGDMGAFGETGELTDEDYL